MAPSIIFNEAVQGEVFLPGQIFVFGGFVLRANSLGRLEQIDSYAPGHQVRFGSLNYTTDIRGDLIFDGFEPVSGAPNSHDEHDLDLPSDSIRGIAPAAAREAIRSRLCHSRTGGWTPPQRPHTHRPWSRTLIPPPMRSVPSDPRTHLWLQDPNRVRLCLSNLIGRQSWSSPPRISFSTRPWATC